MRFGERPRAWSWTPRPRTAPTSCRWASPRASPSGCGSTAPPWSGCWRCRSARWSACFSRIASSLIKGAPSLRRAHLDQLVAALWPARVATRRAYAQSLAQRNALIARIRSGAGSRNSLHSWDAQLARHGLGAHERPPRPRSTPVAASLCAAGAPISASAATRAALPAALQGRDAEELVAELRERIDGDLERGFTGHGPASRRSRGHARGTRAARLRLPGPAAARPAGAAAGRARRRWPRIASSPPLLLLDDVMSELDRQRRARLSTCCARRGPVGDHGHGSRAGAREPTSRASCASRSPTATVRRAEAMAEAR